MYGFRLSRNNKEYIKCNFSKKLRSSTLEVKVEDHVIPQVTRFKYFMPIVQNNRQIQAHVNDNIRKIVGVALEKIDLTIPHPI